MREADGKTITPKGDLTPRIDACRGAVGTGVANAPPVAPKEPSGWLTLWALAQEIAPRTCCLTNWWQNDPPLPMAGIKRAQARLIGSDPTVQSEIARIKGKLKPGEDEVRAVDAVWVNPVILKLLHQEIDRRTRARRRMGNTLMARLSVLVRGRLVAGGYDVTAKLADRTDVNLSERDLVGLEADLPHSALSGDGTIYQSVRVRQRPPEGANTAHIAAKPVAKRPGGRKPKYRWEPAMAALRQRLEDDGAPAPGDGGQAELENYVAERFPPDDCPSEAMIREKVSNEIAIFRRKLG